MGHSCNLYIMDMEAAENTGVPDAIFPRFSARILQYIYFHDKSLSKDVGKHENLIRFAQSRFVISLIACKIYRLLVEMYVIYSNIPSKLL